MQVVECSCETNVPGQQHAVAKYVARHITYADYTKILFLNIDTEFSKVSLYRSPRALCGDPHSLMVIAVATAGGKAISQPETVVLSHTISDIRKSRRALVCRHNKVGIILVFTLYFGWGHNFSVHYIVGDIKQATNKCLITFDT